MARLSIGTKAKQVRGNPTELISICLTGNTVVGDNESAILKLVKEQPKEV